MKTLILALALAVPAIAQAEDGITTSLIFAGTSQHMDLSSRYETPNSRNWGAGVEASIHRKGLNWTLLALSYKDSYYQTATQLAIGVRYKFAESEDKNWSASVGAAAGAMKGSGFTGVGAYPYLEAGYKSVSVRMHFVPKINESTGNMVGLSARIAL